MWLHVSQEMEFFSVCLSNNISAACKFFIGKKIYIKYTREINLSQEFLNAIGKKLN